MQKVKWGVLGTANIARGCTIPGLKLATNAELYAIAGRNEQKAAAFKEEFGFEKYYRSYEELLDDEAVLAVYIPLTNDLDYKWNHFLRHRLMSDMCCFRRYSHRRRPYRQYHFCPRYKHSPCLRLC